MTDADGTGSPKSQAAGVAVEGGGEASKGAASVDAPREEAHVAEQDAARADPTPPPAEEAATPPASASTPEPGSTPSALPVSRSQRPAPQGAPPKRSSWPFGLSSLRPRAALAGAGVAALLGTVAAVIFAAGGTAHPIGQATAARIAGSVAGLEPALDDAGPDAPLDANDDGGPARPTLWRVARLGDDPDVSLVDAVIGHRPMLAALASAGLSPAEAHRVTASLSEERNIERLDPKDAFLLARDKASGRVVAYEFASSPLDVWQAREEADAGTAGPLVARRLELYPEPFRIRTAVVVATDLRAALAEAGLGPVDDVLAMLDDALDGHAEISNIRPGTRLRIVATQERVGGEVVRCASLDAIEYFPAASNAPSIRVYWFGQDEGAAKRHGWYDAKGRQPVHGGWRMPLPLARVVSRFNPHRMHPVLHVVMPHNGVDLAAPVGAPVYATAAGVVASVGFDGPCGNRVQINHPHGMSSVYCHLSRYAAGLHVGEHVEQRQLIAYVGQTGRVTGPHLHFGMIQNGTFIDPMTLRLDGVRVIPRARRDEFDRLRADLDGELDTIPLPPSTGGAVEAPEPDTSLEEFP
ncbi:MAG TPA: peptidoglycan DD-metalloendopeptidase family protein [Polyangiaceae bacterium]